MPDLLHFLAVFITVLTLIGIGYAESYVNPVPIGGDSDKGTKAQVRKAPAYLSRLFLNALLAAIMVIITIQLYFLTQPYFVQLQQVR